MSLWSLVSVVLLENGATLARIVRTAQDQPFSVWRSLSHCFDSGQERRILLRAQSGSVLLDAIRKELNQLCNRRRIDAVESHHVVRSVRCPIFLRCHSLNEISSTYTRFDAGHIPAVPPHNLMQVLDVSSYVFDVGCPHVDMSNMSISCAVLCML